MKKIPMLEKFAAQSLVESDGELVFSKEKFAELIVRECAGVVHLECKDFANGNCFHDDALWKSVTTEYGKNKERGFDPIGMSIHFEKILNQHFGVEE